MTEKEETLDLILSIEDSSVENENKVLAPLMEEIALIQDQGIIGFVKAVLLKAPQHFWTMPSAFSSTEECPPDELDKGGNLLHTKRVVRIVMDLAMCQNMDQEDTDRLIAAAILHDVSKGGFGDQPRYDDMHPYTVDTLVEVIRSIEFKRASEGESAIMWANIEDVDAILRIIRCHDGLLSPIPETIPITPVEWILHFANTVAKNLHCYADPNREIQYWRWVPPEVDDGQPE